VVLVSLPHRHSPVRLIAMEVKFVRSAVGESEWSVLLNLLSGAFKEGNNWNNLLEGKNTVKLVICPREFS